MAEMYTTTWYTRARVHACTHTQPATSVQELWYKRVCTCLSFDGVVVMYDPRDTPSSNRSKRPLIVESDPYNPPTDHLPPDGPEVGDQPIRQIANKS